MPFGDSDESNMEVKRWGDEYLNRVSVHDAVPHWGNGRSSGFLDFERGVKVAHRRFLFYKGLGARLERALSIILC